MNQGIEEDYDEDEEYLLFCPDCKGEAVCEGEGFRCVEHRGIFIGCGWKASYESGIEPLCADEVNSVPDQIS